MLINLTTGEIAFHCLRLRPDGGIDFKQENLKNNNGEIVYISPEDLKME